MAVARIKEREWRRRRLLPWAGFVLGGLAWAVSHQWGSDLVQDDCRWGRPWVIGLIGLGALLVALGSAGISLTAWRSSSADQSAPEEGAIRFIAVVSGLSALLFALAIIAQTLSAFIIPLCHA
ncbi:MAG: hypothetical protein JWN69_300 [Alphaproteobacteria bacterium]|jgi:hypothetical protein|nr:hypothetical protein [Alphaproteobacteria bacterium]